VDICSSEKYALVSDFAWYIDVLVILARTKGIDGHGRGKNLGPLVSNQIIDVTLRVLPVRSYAVRRMIGVMLDGGKDNEKGVFSGTFGLETNVSMMPEVLPIAAFIIGEYSTLIDEAVSMEIEGDDDEDELCHYNASSQGTYHAVIQALTDPSIVDSLLLQTQSVYAQAAMKIFAAAACSKKCSDGELEACAKTLTKYLPVFMQSMDAEVQERAFTAFQLLTSLGLTSVPGLQNIDADNGDDSSDEEVSTGKGHAISSMTDDLLNLGIGSSPPTEATNCAVAPSIPVAKSKPGSIASNARMAAATLKYLLIPEPMKPVSSKAQRKKISSAPDHVKALLQNDNMGVFAKLLYAEKARKGSDARSIESVSFTQQQTVRVTPSATSISHSAFPSRPADDGFLAEMMGSSTSNTRPEQASTNAGTSLNSNKQLDPFYLNTSANGESSNSKLPSRFGTIQLLDSDGDNSNNARKKKKNKKARKKNKDIGAADLEFLSGMGAATTSKKDTVHESNVQASIIDSDDDEEDEPALAMARATQKQSSSSNTNAFDSLARIDLTTPLREDEFIPESKHRVVPERHPSSSAAVNESHRSGKKTKKEKKSKASKKSTTTNISTTSTSATSDLLDFGGFATSNATGGAIIPSPANPINNAFDDLLSMDAHVPAPIMALPKAAVVDNTSQTVVKQTGNSSKGLRVWQQATIKATTSAASFDWDDIAVVYRTHSSKNDCVKLSLKLQNSSNITLQNIIINLPGIDALTLNDAAPLTEADAGKVGPFPISSMDVKGNIKVGGHGASIKITIPSSLTLTPIKLQQDQVADMLSTGDWSSYSSKIEIRNQVDNNKVKLSLAQFLSAGEIDAGRGDATNYMLASKSNSGALVIMLVKTTKKGVQVDVKSTDKKLAKAISSDLKRLSI